MASSSGEYFKEGIIFRSIGALEIVKTYITNQSKAGSAE
jgi:hypothetical protein